MNRLDQSVKQVDAAIELAADRLESTAREVRRAMKYGRGLAPYAACNERVQGAMSALRNGESLAWSSIESAVSRLDLVRMNEAEIDQETAQEAGRT